MNSFSLVVIRTLHVPERRDTFLDEVCTVSNRLKWACDTRKTEKHISTSSKGLSRYNGLVTSQALTALSFSCVSQRINQHNCVLLVAALSNYTGELGSRQVSSLHRNKICYYQFEWFGSANSFTSLTRQRHAITYKPIRERRNLRH